MKTTKGQEMNIDWTQQPGPEFKALEYKGVIYWVVETSTGYMDGDMFFSGNHCTIHHNPTTTPYQPEVGEWCETTVGYKYFYIGVDSRGIHIFEFEDEILRFDNLEGFRPIKTERDLLIDIILGVGNMSEGVLADAILSAGFKAPGNKELEL